MSAGQASSRRGTSRWQSAAKRLLGVYPGLGPAVAAAGDLLGGALGARRSCRTELLAQGTEPSGTIHSWNFDGMVTSPRREIRGLDMHVP